MSVIKEISAFVQGPTNTFNVFIEEWWSMDSRDREIKVFIAIPELGTLVDKRFKVFDKARNTPLLELVEGSGIIEIAVKSCEAAVLDSIRTHKNNLARMEAALEEVRGPNDLSEAIILQQLKDDDNAEVTVYE